MKYVDDENSECAMLEGCSSDSPSSISSHRFAVRAKRWVESPAVNFRGDDDAVRQLRAFDDDFNACANGPVFLTDSCVLVYDYHLTIDRPGANKVLRHGLHKAFELEEGPCLISIPVGIAIGIPVAIAVSVSIPVSIAIAIGISVPIAVTIAVTVAIGIAVPIAVAITIGIAVAIAVAVAIAIAITVSVAVAIIVFDPDSSCVNRAVCAAVASDFNQYAYIHIAANFRCTGNVDRTTANAPIAYQTIVWQTLYPGSKFKR
jgi:hypothetical protein